MWRDKELVRATSIFREEMERIGDIARAISAVLVVAIIPVSEAVEGEKGPILGKTSEKGPIFYLPAQRAATILDELGIVHVDVTPALAEHGAAKAYFVHDGHLTPLGHRIAAQAIAQRIEEL